MKQRKPYITDELVDKLLDDLRQNLEEEPFLSAIDSERDRIGQPEENDSYSDKSSVSRHSDAVVAELSESGRKARPDAGNQSSVIKLIAVFLMILLLAWFLPSANVLDLSSASLSAKDRTTYYQISSGNLLNYALSDIYKMPHTYILEMSEAPTPVPNQSKFTTIEDDERRNYNGTPIYYYKDESIEVKCWKEKRGNCIFNFSEIWISHPSQLRRTLVDNVISKKHLAFPSTIFKKTNGVVGMSADYCAFRDYGIVVQYGNVVRKKSRSLLDTAIYDKKGNFSYCEDNQAFFKSDLFINGDVIHTFAFGPTLIDNYKVRSSWKLRSYICQANEPYPRAAICQFDYDKHYLLCTVDLPGLTLTDFANELSTLGVRFAYNLDGGQTATLMFNQSVINKVAYGGERPVSDILYFATAVPND